MCGLRGSRVARVGARKKLLQIVLAIVVALQLAACSKTVQWEEEVPLNTGETIWVKRSDSYVKGGEPGNPLKWSWGIERRKYEFLWHGRSYTYQTEPKISLGAILLYASTADNIIAIVDVTPNCTKPGYGEFRWDKGGWQLQKNISPILIGQSRNLMAYYSATDGEIPVRVTQEFIRNSRFDLPQRGGEESRLLESRIATNCSRMK